MTNEIQFTQILLQSLEKHGAQITFDSPPEREEALWNALFHQQTTQEQQALDAIAESLRKNTRDFDCIEEIICILESLGYCTIPRHDFG